MSRGSLGCAAALGDAEWSAKERETSEAYKCAAFACRALHVLLYHVQPAEQALRRSQKIGTSFWQAAPCTLVSSKAMPGRVPGAMEG